MAEEAKYDPKTNIRRLSGKGGGADYLDVKFRVKWFRSEYPHGTIETEHIEIGDTRAIFRAVIRNVTAEGVIEGMATGYGSETATDFGDFIEKAETKAVGRALNALGYSTEAAVGDEPQPTPQQPQRPAPRQQAPPADADLRKLHGIAKERGLSHQELHAIAVDRGVSSLKDLNPAQLAKFEVWLQRANPDALRMALEKAGIKLIPDDADAVAVAGTAGADRYTR